MATLNLNVERCLSLIHIQMCIRDRAYQTGVYSDYSTTIYALTAAIDAKDHYTFSHSENVAYYSRELAKAYGMNEEGINICLLYPSRCV